jgi:hypothetical protein
MALLSSVSTSDSDRSGSNKSLWRLIIDFNDDFYKTLSKNCSNPNFYKQTLTHDILNSISDLNSLNLMNLNTSNSSNEVTSFDGRFNLTLTQHRNYLLRLYIQTAFDAASFHIGTYIIKREKIHYLSLFEPKIEFSLEKPYIQEFTGHKITADLIEPKVIFRSTFFISSFSYVLADLSKLIKTFIHKL